MKKLGLYLATVMGAWAQTVTSVTPYNLSHSAFQVRFTTAGPAWHFARGRVVEAPGACADGKSGFIQGFGTDGTGLFSGLKAGTAYQACVEVSPDNDHWSRGSGISITTQALPAVHPARSFPPVTFNTNYPDTSGYRVVNVARDCHDLTEAMNHAVDLQLQTGTVINIPAGSVCTGQFLMSRRSPDVVIFHADAVNVSNSTITTDQVYQENQALIFSVSYGPGGIALPSPLAAGHLYTVHIPDAGRPKSFQLRDRTGTLVTFGNAGGGNLQLVPYPRKKKTIIIRTSTPDDQLPPEKTRISPAWAGKMAKLQAPPALRGIYARNQVLFGINDTDYGNSAMNSDIRLVGIELTYAPDPNASTSIDPPAGEELFVSTGFNQNIVMDRCYLHGLPTPNRMYRGLTWDGMNVAIIDSYFEHMTFWRPAFTGLGITQKGDSRFVIEAGSAKYGVGSANLPRPVTVNTAGNGNGTAWSYLDATGKLQIALPPGVTGTCSGGPCAVFTTDNVGATQYLQGEGGFAKNPSDGLYWIDPIFNTKPSRPQAVSLYGDLPGPTDRETVASVPFEISTRFYSDADGYILGARFYRLEADKTTDQTASLWDDNGKQLATGKFSSLSESGWQTAYFKDPVAITHGAWYRASYHTHGNSPFRNGFYRNFSYTGGNGILHTAATYRESNGGCFSDNGAAALNDWWPTDAVFRPRVGVLGCLKFSNGKIVAKADNYANFMMSSTAYSAEGCNCMIGGYGPGPYMAINNHIEGAGNLWHHDDGGGMNYRSDYTYKRNEFIVPDYAWYGGPHSDGYRYSMRQALEWKGGHRIYMEGNTFRGAFNEITGSSLTIAAHGITTGISDMHLKFNEFAHVPGVIQGAQTGANWGPPNSRFWMEHNLAWDLDPNRHAPGMHEANGWFIEGPNGAEDVIVDHNTVVNNHGGFVPAFVYAFDKHSEGVRVTNNIMFIDSRYNGVQIDGGVNNNENSCRADATPPGEKTVDCMWSDYVWEHNLMIPLAASGSDADRSTIRDAWRKAASNNFIPKWNSTALVNIGWFNFKGAENDPDFRLKGNSPFAADGPMRASDRKDLGADIEGLRAAQGVVLQVETPDGDMTASSAVVAFRAPDAQACPIDFSATDAALMGSFARVQDRGGDRNRKVTLSGLRSNTTYHYRINCAAQQPIGQFRTKQQNGD